MQGLFLLILLILSIWLWRNSMMVREIALNEVRHICHESHLQLLDGGIYLRKIWPTRLENGHIGLLRFYHFDYTENGDNRLQGLVVMAADQLEYLQIEKNGQTVITTRSQPHQKIPD